MKMPRSFCHLIPRGVQLSVFNASAEEQSGGASIPVQRLYFLGFEGSSLMFMQLLINVELNYFYDGLFCLKDGRRRGLPS